MLPMIVLCGSIRSSLADLKALEQALARQDVITLFPVEDDASGDNLRADALHLARIVSTLSYQGEVMVLALTKRDGSIGDSTQREIHFAGMLGMHVGRIDVQQALEQEESWESIARSLVTREVLREVIVM